MKYCFTVHENVFNPIPKVKSAVIKIKRNNRKELNCNESKFIEIVKSAYNHRRKTLRNSLKKFNLDHLKLNEILKKRAEDLSIEDFIIISKNVK